MPKIISYGSYFLGLQISYLDKCTRSAKFFDCNFVRIRMGNKNDKKLI